MCVCVGSLVAATFCFISFCEFLNEERKLTALLDKVRRKGLNPDWPRSSVAGLYFYPLFLSLRPVVYSFFFPSFSLFLTFFSFLTFLPPSFHSPSPSYPLSPSSSFLFSFSLPPAPCLFLFLSSFIGLSPFLCLQSLCFCFSVAVSLCPVPVSVRLCLSQSVCLSLPFLSFHPPIPLFISPSPEHLQCHTSIHHHGSGCTCGGSAVYSAAGN